MKALVIESDDDNDDEDGRDGAILAGGKVSRRCKYFRTASSKIKSNFRKRRTEVELYSLLVYPILARLLGLLTVTQRVLRQLSLMLLTKLHPRYLFRYVCEEKIQ